MRRRHPSRAPSRARSRPRFLPALSVFAVALAALAPAVAGAAETEPSRATAQVGDRLLVSAAATRANPEALAGATLPDPAYVFLPIGTMARKVAFHLDGASVPLRVKYHAPWDVAGTKADGTAKPWAPKLTAGTHTVSARIHRRSGVQTVRAAFTVPATGGSPTGGFGPESGRPFAPDSAWNAPIPADPVLDPDSAAIAGYLGGDDRGYANIYEFGNPVFNADASTSRYTVDCTQPWGTCGLEEQPVPIPADATPAPGSDGAMVVIDWSTRRAYDFWQARRTPSGGWEASWGGYTSIDGDGRGGATGAGVSVLAGNVRAYEVRAGRIDHALVFSTDNSCRTTYRFPATKTDGRSGRADCIPEGARVQLDPTIDIDVIPGITPGEKAVAKALQRYGAYNRDNGGARMAFAFENPAGEPDPYPAAGLAWDYFHMPHIPWDRLRVLRQWDGR
jgi:hypothetical protein